MFKLLLKQNSSKKLRLISEYLKGDEILLDFGCGDLLMAKDLKNKFENLKITGVDVVNFENKNKDIKFIKYNGEKLPFKKNHFDVVISFHVLHHTTNPEKYFNEIARVAKKKIILVESVARSRLEFPGMMFMDWLFNIWKPEKIPLTYKFLSFFDWNRIFKRNHLFLEKKQDAEVFPIPKFFPTGISTLFLLKKSTSIKSGSKVK